MRISRLLMVLCVLVMTGGEAMGAKRNVVLFVTDDQSPDMGCYGNKDIKTPVMDSLAADGVRFTHAFCTTASCSASRSVILTGLHNHANGHYGHQHSYHKFASYENVKSLPVMLGKLGYRTGRVGKYHVAPAEVYKFDTVIRGSSRHPVQMANNSKRFIEADDDKPFFLYFCTSDPHRGGGVAGELPHKPDRFGNLPNKKSRAGIKPIFYDPAKLKTPPYLPNTDECRAEMAQYYQSVSRIDQGLGRLIEVLKEAGKWDDTLIIYISDHGIAMPGAKTTVYEPGLRAPLLVRNPYQKKRGLVSHSMISWVDLTPTILDFAGGIDSKTGGAKASVATRKAGRRSGGKGRPYLFHGRSFLGILDEKEAKGWDVIYASHTFHEITMYYPMRVIRDKEYKLIWNIAHPLPYPFASDLWVAPTWQAQYKKGMSAMYGPRTVGEYIHRPQFELFDMKNDPWESKNLAGDAKYKEVLEKMKARLKTFQKKTNDPWIMKWNYE